MVCQIIDTEAISIHASREGGDQRNFGNGVVSFSISITPPVREATHFRSGSVQPNGFQSTPREGGTPPVREATCAGAYFF